MKTYVALLRGINLGSHNKVAMSALRTLVEELGCSAVTTYIQSGNLVLRSAKPKADGVKRITTGDWGGDEVEVIGAEAYLHCPNGYGRSKLGNAFVEKQ